MDYEFDAEFLKRIIERMQSSLYITDPVTHEILYTNGYIKEAFNCEMPEGKYCWEILQKGYEGTLSFLQKYRLWLTKNWEKPLSGGSTMRLQAVIISIMTGWRNGTGAGITYRIPWILPPFFSCPLRPLLTN